MPIKQTRWGIHWVAQFNGLVLGILLAGSAWAQTANWTDTTILKPDAGEPYTLAWTTQGLSDDSGYLTVEEKRPDGEVVIHRLEGSEATFVHATPGKYVYQLKACTRDRDNGDQCGPWSGKRQVRVQGQAEPVTEAAVAFSSAASSVGGPDELRPGEWSNPNYGGQAFSFYWASELRYAVNHENYGNSYDLLAYWFTYRDFNKYSGTSNEDWKPVFLSSQLQAISPNEYQGPLYYVDSGVVQTVGTMTVTFSADNRNAEVSLDSDLPGLVGTITDRPLSYFGDQIGVGSVPNTEVDHYSGQWQRRINPSTLDNSYFTLHWIENSHESMIVAFYDDWGHPVWVRGDQSYVDTNGHSSKSQLDFCTVGVVSGYNPFNPSGSWAPAFDPGNCEGGGVDAGRSFYSVYHNTHIRNGTFWADIDLEADRRDPDSYGTITKGASLVQGTQTAGVTHEKTNHFHDIRYFYQGEQNAGECTLNSSGVCNVTLQWFVDGDYPDASVWVHGPNGYQRLQTLTEPTTVNFNYAADTAGSYRFYLKRTNQFSSPTMAYTGFFRVYAAGSPLAANPELPPSPALQAFPAENTTSAKVGSLPGSFRVNESGAATYSVPIITAPGSGGVAPELSLVYSSQNGNGHLGVGWQISGLSSITRCPQSIEVDGPNARTGVQFDDQDRLCLDGQRLILVSGNYHAIGSEYRTEIDSISKIVAVQASDSSRYAFKVYRKDGSVADYGTTSNTRVYSQAHGFETFSWAIARTEDTAGNYIEYEYRRVSQSHLEHYPTLIKYTGNSNAGTAPYAEIAFTYDTARSDVIEGWLAGAQLKTTRRLIRVHSRSTDSNGTLKYLRSYQLNYGSDGLGRSVITSMRACSDNTLSVCQLATSFDWLDSSNTISTIANQNLSGIPKEGFGHRAVDINGDGFQDLFYLEKDGTYFHARIHFGSPTGLGSKTNFTLNLPADPDDEDKPVHYLIMDYDNDGYNDIVFVRSSGYLYGKRWSGVNFQGQVNIGQIQDFQPTSNRKYPAYLSLMDHNGDGLADILYGWSGVTPVQPGNPAPKDYAVALHAARPATPAGYFSNVIEVVLEGVLEGLEYPDDDAYIGNIFGTGNLNHIFDYDGDGAVDLMINVTNTPVFEPCTDPSTGCIPQSVSQTNPGFITNSTGTTANGGNRGWLIYRSNGDGLFEKVYEHPGRIENHQLYPVDMNQDGLADLIYRDADSDLWQFKLNTGAGYQAAVSIGTFGGKDENKTAQLLDYNGDGYVDILYPENASAASSKWLVKLNVDGKHFDTGFINSGIPTGDIVDDFDFSVFGDFTGNGKIDQFFFNRASDGGINGIELRWGGNALSGNNGFEAANVIQTITDGFGAKTEIDYGSLTQRSVYTRGNNAISANWGDGSVVFDLIAPSFVVKEVRSSAPTYTSTSTMAEVRYHYKAARVQGGGRGYLGFAEVITYDPMADVRTATRYRQDFPYIGMPADTLQTRTASPWDSSDTQAAIKPCNANCSLPNWGTVSWSTATRSGEPGTIQAYSINQYAQHDNTNGYTLPYQSAMLEKSYSYGGSLLSQSLNTTAMSTYGDPTQIINETRAANNTQVGKKTVVNQYTNNLTKWYLGRLTSTTVTHERPSQATQVRESQFNYHTNGQLREEIVEPNDPDLKLTTTYSLDTFGNRVRSDTRGQGFNTRSSYSTYDALGRWIIESKNAYNQITETVLSRDQFGNPLQVQNMDGILTEFRYDRMGRTHFSRVETGGWQQRVYVKTNSACSSTRTRYYQETTAAGQAASRVCYDQLGREVGTQSTSFNGSSITTSAYYDYAGRLTRQSEPKIDGSSYWTITAYDAIGRPTKVTAPDGGQTTYSYNNLRVTTTNALGQQRHEDKNPLGEVIKVTDHLGGTIDYGYDAVGNLAWVDGPLSGTADRIDMTYDVAGRKIAMSDPDKGDWVYDYLPTGEMIEQIDGKGQRITFEHDRLGRMIRRKEYTSGGTLDQEYYWQYSYTADPASNYIGKLVRECQAATCTGAPFRVDYTYDSLGRAQLKTTRVDGQTFTEETTYDQYGRVFQQFDASGDERGLRYIYNSHGYLSQLKEAREGVNGMAYQTVNQMDQRGNITQMTLGNGVTVDMVYDAQKGRLIKIDAYHVNGIKVQDQSYIWDELDNLLERMDQSGSKDFTERFQYDGLNRLTHAKYSSQQHGVTDLTIGHWRYDEAGNMTLQHNYSWYTYNTQETSCSKPAGIHAVSKAANKGFCYDENGNHVTRSDGLSVQYTTFDKAAVISKNGLSNEFRYGPNRARYQRIDKTSGSTTRTTYYIGNVEVITDNGIPEHRRHIAGIATQNIYLNSNVVRTNYLLKDHLGSVDQVLDENGQVLAELSFDAFGLRREAYDWSSKLSGVNPAEGLTTRGFTGHEQLDDLGLIHMNGRIYDPRIGRFIQADPLVQAPKDTQSLNRYSYTFNNPLKYTDPSGYSASNFFKRNWRTIVAVALAIVVPQAIELAWGLAATSWQAIVAAGAISGQVGAGNLRGLLSGAFSAALFYGVGKYFKNAKNLSGLTGTPRDLVHAASHGVVSGISSEIQGGKFGHGFVSGGLSKSFSLKFETQLASIDNIAAETTIMAVVGGTIAEASGGKFANGALSSSMGYLFNQVASKGTSEDALERAKREGDAYNKKQQQRTIKWNNQVAGKISGSVIGTGIAAVEVAGFIDADSLPEGIQSALTVTEIFGGAQAIGMSTAIGAEITASGAAIGSVMAAKAGAFALAFGGGFAIGTGINNMVIEPLGIQRWVIDRVCGITGDC